MSVLGKVLKGVALSGVLASSAAAEDTSANDVRLSRSDWRALEVVKDFNTCVEDAQREWPMPYSYSLVEDYNQRREDSAEYYNTVTVPYETALQEYRDANSYTEKLAEAYYRLQRAYPQAQADLNAGDIDNVSVRAFGLLRDEYQLLMDQSKAEFDAVTTLQIPEKEEFSAGDAEEYYNAVISGCADDLDKGISEWVNVIWGDTAGSYMAPTLQNVRFNQALETLKTELGPKTYLELTRAP